MVRPKIEPTLKKERWANYIKNKKWVCDICKKEYQHSGRTNHIRTKKHNRIKSELIAKGEYVDVQRGAGRPRKKSI